MEIYNDVHGLQAFGFGVLVQRHKAENNRLARQDWTDETARPTHPGDDLGRRNHRTSKPRLLLSDNSALLFLLGTGLSRRDYGTYHVLDTTGLLPVATE